MTSRPRIRSLILSGPSYPASSDQCEGRRTPFQPNLVMETIFYDEFGETP